jgi:formate-dependent nitrite reductase membrane component NrfD
MIILKTHDIWKEFNPSYNITHLKFYFVYNGSSWLSIGIMFYIFIILFKFLLFSFSLNRPSK